MNDVRGTVAAPISPAITGFHCVNTVAYHADDIVLYVYEWRRTPSSATGSRVTRVTNRSHRERRCHSLQFVRISAVISKRVMPGSHHSVTTRLVADFPVTFWRVCPTIPRGSHRTVRDMLRVCLPLLDPSLPGCYGVTGLWTILTCRYGLLSSLLS